MNKLTDIPDFSELRAKVIGWLKGLKISEGGYDYYFSPGTGDSLFTTCFALYILDLFRETDNLSKKEKKGWTNYINSFQRREDGLFYPDPIFHPDKERAVFQATSFCLSALDILNSAPEYPLLIVNNWRTKTGVEDYLIQRGCHLGKGGSGNKAMFQAILMTHEYERTQDPELLASINVWFDFHNRNQNKYGFWGNGSRGQLYKGLQNAFHQFVIYEYWNRGFPRLDIIAHTVIELQANDGFFSNLPGGGSCKDYDSLHFLLSYENKDFLKENIDIIEMAVGSIISRWNQDGGFCENSLRPYSMGNYSQLISFISSGSNLKINLYRGESVLREIIKPKKYKMRNWVPGLQAWNESTLWDTWFRCLAIGEMSCFLNSDNFQKFRFLKHIGIGFNKINHENRKCF
jgi:hypothetical protein